MKEVFVVTAYRWGDRESHSYVVGVFDSLRCAISASKKVFDDRGTKYSCEVVKSSVLKEVPDNLLRTCKIVKSFLNPTKMNAIASETPQDETSTVRLS